MNKYIDTEKLEEVIISLNNKGWDITRNDFKLIDNVLFEFPTADVQKVQHGRWKNIDIIHNRKDAKITDWQQAQCSICGKWHTTPYLYNFDWYNYCPNCGSKMDGEEE